MAPLAVQCRHALPSSLSPAAAPGSRRLVTARRPRLAVVRAQEGGSPPPTQQDDEQRIAALEAAARARKGIKAEQAEAFRGTAARPARSSSSGSSMAEWKEGQLFPEGWDEMDPLQKASELYMGQRGFLFWANKAALWSVGGLLVGWAVFRFVGPALGLYTLQQDLSTPNFL